MIGSRKMKAHEIKIDSEFQNLIPPLSAIDEKSLLEQNLLRDGVREPLIIWDGQGVLIDGHHRLEIIKKHDLDFEVKQMVFETREDVKIWMINNQFGRRNLTSYTRSDLALQLKDIIAAQAQARMAAGGGDHGNQYTGGKVAGVANSTHPAVDKGRTREKLAKKAGVGSNTLSKVEYINKHGSEELKSDLRDGKITVNKAYKQLKGVSPKKKKTKEPSTIYQEEQAFNEEVKRQIEKDKSPFHAMLYVDGAISMMSQIRDDDPDIEEAMDKLIAWAVKRKNTKK